MPRRCLLMVCLACCLVCFVPVAAAQSDLTQTYISPDLDYQFAYPAGWEPVPDRPDRFTNGVTEFFVRGPNSIQASWTPPFTSPLDLLQRFDSETLAQGTISEIELGDRPFARFDVEAYGDPPRQIVILATVFENGDPAYLGLVSANQEEPQPLPAEDIQTVLAIAATLQPGPRAPLPQTLANTAAADWRETIRELEQASVIATGSGRLAFQENYAFFEGTQNRVTPLARDEEVTHAVVAATLDLTTTTDDNVRCFLYGRYLRDSPDDEDNVIQAGVGVRFNQSNHLCILVWNAELGVNRTICTPDGTIYDSPVRVLLLLLGERVHLYADGALVLRDIQAPIFPGAFATGLNGEDPGARCEVTAIWGYEATPLVPGLCTATASAAINQRGGPGTNYAVAGQLAAGQGRTVSGQQSGADGFTWYQLEGDSWVREDLVSLVGDCGGLPEVTP